jgi:fluoroquinolone transport system permease protein
MKKILTLSIHDFQLIYRDKVLLLILFIPVIMLSILWWGIPPLMESLSIDAHYYPLVVGVFSIVAAISPAYLVSFIMLDEKDEDVLIVIRTMPLSPVYFLSYRIIFTLIFSFLTSILILGFSEIYLPLILLVLISVLISLIAPITALTIITFSRNKIEGLTFLKGINFLIILPVLSFFTGTMGKIAVAAIPTFWIFQALMNKDYWESFLLYLGSGLVINILILLLLGNQFIKRVFYKK